MSSIEEAVRKRAYELWEHAGRPEGRNDEFRHAAEAELHAKEETEEELDSMGPLMSSNGSMTKGLVASGLDWET